MFLTNWNQTTYDQLILSKSVTFGSLANSVYFTVNFNRWVLIVVSNTLSLKTDTFWKYFKLDVFHKNIIFLELVSQK